MPIRFPSLAFFEALRDEMRAARDRFGRLGFFDTTFAVRVLDGDGGALFEATLAFEVFDCVAVREGVEADPDFVLEGPLSAWREMLDTIHALGAADAAHSINTLTQRASVLNEYLDRTEHTVAGIAGSVEWLESLIVLAAGSRERAHLERGSAFARRWFAQTVADHLARCEAAGLGDRRGRSRLPGLANRLAA